MSSTIPTPGALLTRAADILDQRGWFQGSYFNDTGCVCVLGAIHAAVAEAAGQDVTEDLLKFPRLPLTQDMQPLVQSYNHAVRALNDEVPFGNVLACAIPDWNDENGRTKEEVQAMLRRAAEAGAE
jgi:hypothetical protein